MAHLPALYFGVELELILARVAPQQQQLSIAEYKQWLAASYATWNKDHAHSQYDMLVETGPKKDRKYTTWLITDDDTIKPDPPNPANVGIEFVGPFIRANNAIIVREMTAVYDFLNQSVGAANIVPNPSCSTQIHLSPGGLEHPDRVWNLDQVKGIASAAYYFEEAIRLRLPLNFWNNRFALEWRSFQIYPQLIGPNFFKLARPQDELGIKQQAAANPGPPSKCVILPDNQVTGDLSTINDKISLQEIVGLLNVNVLAKDKTERNYRWNFLNLDRGAHIGAGTIEFRAPPPSTTSVEAIAWIDFCVDFVTTADLERDFADWVLGT